MLGATRIQDCADVRLQEWRPQRAASLAPVPFRELLAEFLAAECGLTAKSGTHGREEGQSPCVTLLFTKNIFCAGANYETRSQQTNTIAPLAHRRESELLRPTQ